MDIEYRILNLYKTKQYDECLKLCSDTAASAGEHSRMLDFVRVRAQTVLSKVVGGSYEEVTYDIVHDELGSTAMAKTPRPGTTFRRDAATGRFTPSALDVSLQAQRHDPTPDWWWEYSSARCYQQLGMYRPAEESLRRALKGQKHIALYLRLVCNYVQQNQPLTALEVCKQGLAVFHDDTTLMTEQARIHEEMGSQAAAVACYRRVAVEDAMNVEATASIAMYNFYNDQPEIALRYYRRLLATCQVGGEIYNNLGLCCLYCHQWDLVVPCFRQALFLATDTKARADIWFNLAHVALSTGDHSLARRCLQLSLALCSDHESARKALVSVNSLATGKLSQG